jgi:deoxycytidylate deaminase
MTMDKIMMRTAMMTRTRMTIMTRRTGSVEVRDVINL